MILDVQEVNKTFDQPGSGRLQVLTGVGFSIDRRETAAIVGQSGSGMRGHSILSAPALAPW